MRTVDTAAGNDPLPAVTVIMPVRNEEKDIARRIRDLEAQDYPADRLEILIVDGMSTDGTAQRVRAHQESERQDGAPRPRLRLIENPARIVSAALNIGLREASSGIVLRMDAHTEYADDYVRACVAALRRTGAQNVGGPARTRADGCIARAIAAAYHSPFSVGGARFHDPDFEGDVDTVTYGCWHTQYLRDIGGFDEELVRNQDDELNLRIVRAGGRIHQDPRIRSWYSPRSSLRALWKQYMQYGYWKVRVIRKHRLPASPRHLVPAVFVLGLLTAPVLGVFWHAAWLFLAIAAAAYVCLLAGFSLAAARRGGWDVLPLLPPVFFIYHASYGSGFLAGLADALLRGRKARSSSRLFASLSR